MMEVSELCELNCFVVPATTFLRRTGSAACTGAAGLRAPARVSSTAVLNRTHPPALPSLLPLPYQNIDYAATFTFFTCM